MPNKIFQIIISGLVLALISASVVMWLSFTEMNKTVTNLSSQTNTSVENTTAAITGTKDNAEKSTTITSTTSEASDSSLSALTEKISKLELTTAKLEKRLDNISTASAETNLQQSTNSSATTPVFKKETLYLGSTATTNRDWTESGLEIGINSINYPTGAQAKLEAGMSIIGGEVWVRLKNKSTGAIIPASEITHNTNTTTWKTSSGFDLHEGGYTYVLELRSTSGETANVSGARIIIE